MNKEIQKGMSTCIFLRIAKQNILELNKKLDSEKLD